MAENNTDPVETDQSPADDAADEPATPETSVSRDDNDGTVQVSFKAKPKTPRTDRQGERVRNRYEEVADRARRAEERAEAAERRINEFAASQRQAPQQQASQDPYEVRLGELKQNQELVLSALRNASDEPSARKLKEQFDALEGEKWKVMEERIARRVGESSPRQQPGQTEEAMIRGEFPDVVANQRALKWAIGEYHRMTMQEEDTWKPNMTTTREAMRRAGEKFGLIVNRQPAASASQQARYGAVPSQAGERAGFDGRLNKIQQRLALAMYPKLSEDEAFAKWATMYAKAEKSPEVA